VALERAVLIGSDPAADLGRDRIVSLVVDVYSAPADQWKRTSVSDQSWGAQQQPGANSPAGPPSGGGAIALTLKYNPLVFLLGLFKPTVQVNGHDAAKGWGRQVLPVPPGQYHLHVHVPYWLPPQVGPADLSVTVHPGQTVELEYRAPMIAFMKGALGAPPQKYPGLVVSIVLLAVSLVILLCVCAGIVGAMLSTSRPSMSSGPPALHTIQYVLAALRR
jgi:hypothetical protein